MYRNPTPIKIARICGLALFAAALAPGVASANGFRNPPPGAAALATDGGKSAFIDDASAVTHNPANLTELEGPQMLGALTLIYSYTDFDAPMGGPSAHTRDKWNLIPAFFAAWPLEEKDVALGIGVTSPYGQATKWSKESPFRGFAPYSAEMLTVDVNPTVAARIGESLSVGAGVEVLYSELDLRQIAPWSAILMAPVPDGSQLAEADGVGVGGNIGATFKFLEKHRFAVTYRLPIKVEYEGSARVTAIPPPLMGTVSPRSDYDTEIEFPALLTLGYGVALSDTLRVGADVEWVEFSRFDELPVDVGVNNGLGLSPESIPQNWDDIWTVGFAAEWDCTDALTLRGGYKFMESPIPDETHAPTLPDADRHLITLGLGYTHEQHTIDVAYVYQIFGDRDVSTQPVPAFNGDYELTSHLLGVSYGYRF